MLGARQRQEAGPGLPRSPALRDMAGYCLLLVVQFVTVKNHFFCCKPLRLPF